MIDRICKNCAHYSKIVIANDIYYRCNRNIEKKELVNPVTGSRINWQEGSKDCASERSVISGDPLWCGKEGMYFEQKNTLLFKLKNFFSKKTISRGPG